MSDLTLIVRGAPVHCVVERDGDQFVARVGAVAHRLRLSTLGPGTFRVSSNGCSHILTFAREHARRFLHVDGHTVAYELAETAGAAARRAAGGDLTAPMPGTVTHVLVSNGDRVAQGQPLLIVEAMKMEHVIRAPHAARVRAVRVRPGDQVDGGAVVAEIDGDSGGPAR